MTLSPGNVTVHPSSNGEYMFTELAEGTYTLTPSLSGYVFKPQSLSLTVDGFAVRDGNRYRANGYEPAVAAAPIETTGESGHEPT